MSKKDKQHQHIQPIEPVEKKPDTSGDPSSMGSEARIQHLEAELAQARAERAGLKESMEAAQRLIETAHADLGILAKAARHGSPPEGFEPKTTEGKEALEQVVLLGNIAREQRHRASELQLSVDEASKALGTPVQSHYQLVDVARDAAETRKALRSDLMVLEQTAAGRAPDIALQTDLGKSAAHAFSECLTMMDKMNEQRLEGPALPLAGWVSDTARQLVEAVSPHNRVLLLGDLLAQLLPHTAIDGENETASDVLRRLIAKLRAQWDQILNWERMAVEHKKERDALSERMVKIQSAMVARRAPDAEAGGAVARIGDMLRQRELDTKDIVQSVARALQERDGLRAFFSEAPLTAVAVRDDGAKGPVRERFSLLVLTWDGRSVQTQVVEGTRPWGDISPYLDTTVRKHLIPGAYW